ncbi:MAG: hypothetical protein M9939_19175 [Mesorhizobium sp.]|nr:hypothetical protein [Mesorhizobium sp.]MCO5163261.1 hypothetical protein [Mesorhizobium sp.]
MISSVSSTSSVQLISGSSSGQETEASLKKEIAAKETEAKSAKDQAEATKLAAEIAALKSRLAALQAKQSSSQTNDNSAAARQAEFDVELLAEASNSITI